MHPWPLSARTWSAQIPALSAAGYRVVSYDRRGFGRSDKPLTGYIYENLTKDLNSLIEALDLREITLVGSSRAAVRSRVNCRPTVRIGCAASCSPRRSPRTCYRRPTTRTGRSP
ncbi:hypothetical protein MMAN_38190 [Mycobacterium mantenii]|uniref:AB hydrolase-1 domain-containing protein n=1 Tax=Mycobacterium mantenii TaxID=560555 RepID=A0ABN6AE21_MYCNT|nr:hypothetical protein MMAN_38190 [Mycobacterium mantenii]